MNEIHEHIMKLFVFIIILNGSVHSCIDQPCFFNGVLPLGGSCGFLFLHKPRSQLLRDNNIPSFL